MWKKFICLLSFGVVAVHAQSRAGSYYLDIAAGAAVTNYYATSGNSFLLRIDGGYDLNNFLGFQLGCENLYTTNMNSPENGSYSLNGGGVDVALIPNLPLGNNSPLSIFLRIGAGFDVINSEIGNMSQLVDVLGTGINYNFSKQMSAGGQWISRGNLIHQTPTNYQQNSFLLNVGFYF